MVLGLENKIVYAFYKIRASVKFKKMIFLSFYSIFHLSLRKQSQYQLSKMKLLVQTK